MGDRKQPAGGEEQRKNFSKATKKWQLQVYQGVNPSLSVTLHLGSTF